MVYQEGFRDPGQKSSFGSSQSLCPAPQWVVMAASYSRRSPWVSLAAAFPAPSGGCCPGRPCRVTSASTLCFLSQPRQRPSLPFQRDVCSIGCCASQNTIAGHISPLRNSSSEDMGSHPPWALDQGPDLIAREEHKHSSHCLALGRGLMECGKPTHCPRAHSQPVVVCSRELGHPGPETSCGNKLPVWDVPPPTRTPSAVGGDQL